MTILISVEQEADVALIGSRAVGDTFIRLVSEIVASGGEVTFVNQPLNDPLSVAFTVSNEKELEKWTQGFLGRLRLRDK